MVRVTGRRINMAVRRLGGGYGGKLQHPSRVASAAAVAALALNRPVRLVLGINTNMTLLGSRLPYLIQYQVRQTDNISQHRRRPRAGPPPGLFVILRSAGTSC